MPFVADWNPLGTKLANLGAQQVARPAPNVMVFYSPNTGEYIKVTKVSGGYQYSIHRSRAECGC